MTKWRDPEQLERQIVETLEHHKKAAGYAHSMMEIFQQAGFSRQEAFFFVMADRVSSLVDALTIEHIDDDDEEG